MIITENRNKATGTAAVPSGREGSNGIKIKDEMVVNVNTRFPGELRPGTRESSNAIKAELSACSVPFAAKRVRQKYGR